MKLKTFKIIVIGQPGVGKTSLVRRFTKTNFDDKYNPTIGVEFDTKEVEIGGLSYQLQLWDTVILIGRTRKI